jgi:ATP-binding cassette subfamily B protein
MFHDFFAKITIFNEFKTLPKILTKLYIPTSGFISLGNLKLSSIPVDEWRKKIGVITQDSALLKDSILNNIVFGREFDSERLIKAVTIANIKKI